jgi:carbamoyltransferase
MIILGINSYHPDASAALVIDGRLVAACEEERFRRIKHYAGFPEHAIRYCLKEAGLSIGDVDYLAVPRDPNARIWRKALYGLKIPALAGRRLCAWRKTFDLKQELAKAFDVDTRAIRARLAKIEHHRAHLASSFFVSGLDKAFLFSTDALGDFASTMWGRGEGNTLTITGEVPFPHSLGFYYSAITQYLGFPQFGDEYKVMGLAPYGRGTRIDAFRDIVKTEKGSFRLNLKYFLHHRECIDMNFEDGYPRVDRIFSPFLEEKLGKRRMPDEPLQECHKDIAFCLQKRLEEVIERLLTSLERPREVMDLCLAGGVAHNCVVNGKLVDESRFKRIFVPPAPGDGGLSVGAAFYLYHQILGMPRLFTMEHASWGPGFGEEETAAGIKAGDITKQGCIVEQCADDGALCEKVAAEIAKGSVVGWFQGRMEFGPRALGQRSILADPRRKNMKDILNKRIKRREPFRPFAPSILEEHTGDYFEKAHPSPFMSYVYRIHSAQRDRIPAVCHVDGTARLQTVRRSSSPVYWRLIDEFRKITGVPVVLNTSFNENEPIICTPAEAIDCFLRTRMDTLAMGRSLIRKSGTK